MITKRKGNGQTECVRCKEKGKFALYWDSWLYTYNEKSYCLDCLFEILEEKDKVIDEVIKEIKYLIGNCDIPSYQGNKLIQILERGKK